MDIETFVRENVHVPYCISFFDGSNNYSYSLNFYKNSDNMIIDCIKDVMVKKYDNYKIYIHNLARFDGIFLLRILANLGKCNPIIHDGKLISIGFSYKGYNVTFRDSKQLLTSSLRELAKSFGVEVQKSIFPYKFVNENNLTYNSHVPDFSFFIIFQNLNILITLKILKIKHEILKLKLLNIVKSIVFLCTKLFLNLMN